MTHIIPVTAMSGLGLSEHLPGATAGVAVNATQALFLACLVWLLTTLLTEDSLLP